LKEVIMPADIHTDHAPRLNATRARQGRWGQHIFWILVVSTVLAAVALFGAWGFSSGDLKSVEHNNGAKTPAEASRYSTEQAPVRQNTTPAN
jgi:flagellar basal body-associated protein FliL